MASHPRRQQHEGKKFACQLVYIYIYCAVVEIINIFGRVALHCYNSLNVCENYMEFLGDVWRKISHCS
jgi:hypothetical protein